MHEVQVPAAAFAPLADPLPRTGWTITATDQQTGSETADAAIDGDPATSWHSRRSGRGARLPHSVTIDMHAVQTVSALTYLPQSATNADGRIGRFMVSVSMDGARWGGPVATGTWADDGAMKTATFVEQTARFVRLTALSEAGVRGVWISAAELNLLGASSIVPNTQYVDLPRTGWTAQASDAETTAVNGAAVNVLDGDPRTVWMSSSSPAPTALPHSITIDMQQSIPVAGLRYLPRPGGGDGTIGAYTIATSADGNEFTEATSGAWTDGQSAKLATFPTRIARYVRLTATSEAGNRGPSTSAAEITLLQQTSAAPRLGSWSSVINFPIVPVSAVLLPGNRLLTFSAYSPVGFAPMTGTAPSANSYTQTAILDLKTGTVSQRVITDTQHQMFCSGIALLPDGRVLVNGGSDSGSTSIYSPSTNTWATGPRMNIPRGYEGDTTLSTGEVFTLGGSWKGGLGGKDGEVFSPNGTWRQLPNVQASAILTQDPAGIFRSDNHGWFFAVSGGAVFHAGPSKQMNWFTTNGAGSSVSAGLRGTSNDAMNGNAVMYDVNKILTVGGAPAYTGGDATGRAFTIDISAGAGQPVTTTEVGSMTYPRSFANSVVLPDGKVLVVGGQPHPAPFTDTGAVLVPELWNPSTGAFTSLAPMAVPRTYHSVALLLPDGRVFSGGGGLCGACATNHSDAQIFTPPYLLNPNGTLRHRPSLSGAPPVVGRGSRVRVTASRDVSQFVLVRAGATTHAIDSDQRRIPLTITRSYGHRYELGIPSDSGVVLPGSYLLFAINSRGTPSLAQQVFVA